MKRKSRISRRARRDIDHWATLWLLAIMALFLYLSVLLQVTL